MSLPVSQNTGTIFLASAALATADSQRTRDAGSFLWLTPYSPMKAGMSLRVQKSFILSNS